MPMLTGSGIAIDSLFYSADSSYTTGVEIQKWNNKLIFFKVNDALDQRTTFLDYRFSIYEVNYRNEVLNTFSPEYGVWAGGPRSYGWFDDIENKYYILIRLANFHPFNASGNDNEHWIMAIDVNDWSFEYVIRLTGQVNFNRFRHYMITKSEDYIYIGTPEFVYSVNLTTGVTTTLNSSASIDGQFSGYSAGYVLMRGNSVLTRTIDMYTLTAYNTITNDFKTYTVNVRSNINPLWTSDSYLKLSNPIVKGNTLFIAVIHTDDFDSSVVLGPQNFDVLVYNLDTLQLIERIIGGGTNISNYYATIAVNSDLTAYIQLRNLLRYRIYSPRPILGNKLLRSNNKVLQT